METTFITSDQGISNSIYTEFGEDGNIRYYDTAWHTLASYSANQWYRLEVVSEASSGSFDIRINDQWFTEKPLRGLPTTFSQIQHNSGTTGTGTFYFGVLAIGKYADPEPSHGSWGIEEQTPHVKPRLCMPVTVKCRKYCENFVVQINFTNAVDVEDFEFEVQYNSTLLDYANVTWDAWSSGTINSTNDGILVGHTSGSAITGSATLATISFQASFHHIWKSSLDWTNDLTGNMFIQWANLSYAAGPDLDYEKGGSSDIDVIPAEVAYVFSPIQGDMNNDGTVNILDLRTVASFYNVRKGDPSWAVASTYDLNVDGVINIFDLVIIATNYGFTYP
jgi:hypothetical protein